MSVNKLIDNASLCFLNPTLPPPPAPPPLPAPLLSLQVLNIITVPSIPTNEEQRAAWERGQPDYHGRDQFHNIQAHLDSKIASVGIV